MSADLFGQGRSLLPYAHCKNIEAWWWKTDTPPPPPPHTHKKKKKKKKKKKFWIITCTTIWLCYSHYGVFCSFILLIYSSQKVSRSLKFYRALHILVLHMHRKFDFDSIDSFLRYGRAIDGSKWRKERKKERKKERTRKLHLQANVTKKVIILYNPPYRL